MRTMSDETEQRVCEEDFGSEEEADVESYLEDNSSDLMDRLRELEVSTHTHTPMASPFFHPLRSNRKLHEAVSCRFRQKTLLCCWPTRVRGKPTRDVWTR